MQPQDTPDGHSWREIAFPPLTRRRAASGVSHDMPSYRQLMVLQYNLSVREFVSILFGIAVALAWLAIWAYALRVLRIAVFTRTPEDRDSRRERIRQMGKLRYILIFGVLGFGLAFALGITTADVLAQESHGWVSTTAKLMLLSVLLGWFHGARTWSEAFRDPVPFPPDYPADAVRFPPDYSSRK